jgi:tetratricopeptide (TPR) repeat protein
VILALTYPGALALSGFPAVDRSRDFNARDYALNILRGVDRNGILFISGDNPSSTILFAQAVLEARRDVAVVNQEALRSGWYRDYVRENLGLAVPEPATVARHLVSDLVTAIVENHPRRPAFALVPRRLTLPPPLLLSPAGMVYRISPSSRPAPGLSSAPWAFQFHGGAPGAGKTVDQRAKINEAVREMRAGYLRAWVSGGRAFSAAGKFERAAQMFGAAARLAPGNEDLRLWHGISLVQLRRYPAAQDAFAAIVRDIPGSHRGHYNLGNVLVELGDNDGARQAYRASLRIEPAFAMAREALKTLN